MEFIYKGTCDCAAIRSYRLAAKALDWAECRIEVFDDEVDGKPGHRVEGEPKEAVPVFMALHDYFMHRVLGGWIGEIVDEFVGFKTIGSC